MKQKRTCRLLIIAIIVLNINFHGIASYSGKQDNSLQWFPSLDADNGTVYIVWADERNGNQTMIMNNQPHKSGDIYLSKGSFKNGWVFDKNIRINEIRGTTGHGSPSIAIDNDTIYVAWEDDRYGFEEIYFSTAERNNIKFKKDSPVVEDAGSRVLPSIAVRNNTAYVAMMNRITWDIEFTEGHSSGGIFRFDKPVRVNDDVKGNWHYAPSLAVDDEKNVCIAWLDARNSDYDIYFSHGIKINGTWQFSKNIRVNDDTSNASHYTPSMAFGNGSAYIAWYDDRNKDLDIYFSAGRPENDSWRFDNNIRVNDEQEGDQMHPAVAYGNEGIFIAWEDGRNGGSDIYFSKSVEKNGSIEFAGNTRVNDIKGKHYDPQIVIDNGNVYVIWQAENIHNFETPHQNTGTEGSDSGDIYFSSGKYNGNDWEFSENIKINDDTTYSFTAPDPVLLSVVLSPVIFTLLLAGVLRKYGLRKNE